MKQPYVTVFDIGSSRISAIVANINKQDEIKVIAETIGHAKGFYKGNIVDFDSAYESIMNVIYELEKSSSNSIKNISISISNDSIKSFFLSSEISLSNQPISKLEIHKLIQKALNKFNINGMDIIHYVPIEFILDNNKIVKNPLNMYANNIKCNIHVIAADSLNLTNISNCFNKCHIEVDDILPSIYPTAINVLSQDDKDMGILIIDIGSAVTSFAVFLNEQITYVDSVNIGSFDITQDIAKHFSISRELAEKVKILFCNSLYNNFSKEKIINLSDISGNDSDMDINIKHYDLYQIIKNKLEIMLFEIKNKYDKLQIDELLSKKLVITGGGSKLVGIKNIASNIFQKQIYIAKSNNNDLFDHFSHDNSSYLYDSAIGYLKIKHLQLNENSFIPESKNSFWYNKIIAWLKENL